MLLYVSLLTIPSLDMDQVWIHSNSNEALQEFKNSTDERISTIRGCNGSTMDRTRRWSNVSSAHVLAKKGLA
jgi:hypothetical protein